MAQKLLKDVEAVYLTLDSNFASVYDKAIDSERLTLRSLHAAARDAYFRAVVSELVDDNVVVQQIAGDLKATTKSLETQLKAMKNVKDVLDVATKAVSLAASIVTLASAW